MVEPTPIEIRPGVKVWIAPLPHDLTRAEAEKIARVVLAHVAEPSLKPEAVGGGE